MSGIKTLEQKLRYAQREKEKRLNNPEYVKVLNSKAKLKRKIADKRNLLIKSFDLIGMEFGRLTVISKAKVGTKKTKTIWFCKCICGKTKEVDGGSLRNGNTKSCGCLRVENSSKLNLIHGDINSREYHSWCNMRYRCYNPNNEDYPNYGGRGIYVCDRWLDSYQNFLDDMGRCPKGMSLDREGMNGIYEKDNCRWVTPIIQANNTRRNVFVTYKDETLTLAQWSRKLNFNSNNFYYKKYKELSKYEIVELFYKNIA